jgi:AcrR family transcriptional regulator
MSPRAAAGGRAADDAVTPVPSKGPGRNRLLTRAQVAQAAFDLIDAEGAAALTITRLAGRLGVSPMTLYGYAESKDAIIAMLPEILLSELPPVPTDQPWEAVIEKTFLSMYRRFVEHRHVTQAITNAAVFVRSQAELIEALIGCLEDAGFSQDEAFALQRAAATYTIGFAFFAIAEQTTDSPRSRTNWTDALEPGEFPRLAEASSLLAAKVDEAQYLRGLRRIVGHSSPAS